VVKVAEEGDVVNVYIVFKSSYDGDNEVVAVCSTEVLAEQKVQTLIDDSEEVFKEVGRCPGRSARWEMKSKMSRRWLAWERWEVECDA
jgi:hypothetical protein